MSSINIYIYIKRNIEMKMDSGQFFNLIFQSFQQKIEELLGSIPVYKEVKNNSKALFFAIDPTTNPLTVYYNPLKIMLLNKVLTPISIDILKNTAIYFANHEYLHTLSQFQMFDPVNWEKNNDAETNIELENSHEKCYYNYKDMKYLFEEFIIDNTINNTIKKRSNLFILYNFKKLKEIIDELSIYIHNNQEPQDETIKSYIKKKLVSEKLINNILWYSIRLFGLDYKNHVEDLFKRNSLEFLLKIIKDTISNLKEIYEYNSSIDQIKGELIKLKNRLEKFDYIEIIFSS